MRDRLEEKRAFLRLHPPAGGVDETPEQKAAREAEEARDKAMVDRIANGVSAGLKPVIEGLAAREKAEPAPIRTESPTPIQRPTEEQLADALIDGNKQEYARLLKQVRAADQQALQQQLGNLSSQGGAAISAVSQSLAEQNPDYKRFKKEIDAEMQQFRAANPGAIVTTEHLKIATEIVKSRHIDELVTERVEEQRRQAREKEDALLPDNSRSEEIEEKEPTSLAEALPGDWKAEFKPKQRGVGGRSDEEELRKMGYKGGLAEFLKVRKELAATEDELGSSFGLDKDYDKATGKWIN